MPDCSLVRGVYLVRLTASEVGGGASEDMEACLTSSLSKMPAVTKIVLVDMEGVRFLRSSGLGAMLAACETLKSRGIRVSVCHVPPFGRNLFRISRLDEILQVFPTREDALDALGWGDADEEAEAGDPSPR